VSWAAALFALFAPRPWGLTLVRVVAPCGFACALLSSASTSAASAALALAGSGIAAILALSAPVASATANALAYGDEQRFPLRIPLPLLLGPVPVAVVLVGLGATSGPAHWQRSWDCPGRRSSFGHFIPWRAAGSCSFPPASRSPIP
jgi:hypothetical protein